jgi:predicted DNA-binding protein (MmcQ/YjbR family)
MIEPDIQSYCLQKTGATLDYPFGPEPAVFKVLGKMFALSDFIRPVPWLSLKCNPDWALALRDIYPAVKPGYHLNKEHWNTVELDGSISDGEVFRFIDHSYDLVVKSLKKGDRERLKNPS